MTNTFLVEVLRKGGLSNAQASAFERCLEDRPICGVSPLILTRSIVRAGVGEMAVYVAAMNELQIDNKRLLDELSRSEHNLWEKVNAL